jgi:hypothetical protein
MFWNVRENLNLYESSSRQLHSTHVAMQLNVIQIEYIGKQQFKFTIPNRTT